MPAPRSLRIAAVLVAFGAWALVASPRVADARALLIYPGSFDPFHLTHQKELSRVQRLLEPRFPDGIDVVVVPNHDKPTHTPTTYLFSSAQRAEIARRSVEGIPGVTIQPPAADGTSSLDQLRAVRRAYPEHQAFVLLGDDAFRGLRKWPGAEQVLEEFSILVSTAPRRATMSPLRALGQIGRGYRLEGGTWRHAGKRSIEILPVPVREVRSHAIRLRLMLGLPIDPLVGKDAAAYVATPPMQQTVARSGIRLIKDALPAVSEHLGPAVAARAGTDGEVAASLAALSNNHDPDHAAQAEARLRARGLPVSRAGLTALIRDPRLVRIFAPRRAPGAR